MAQERIELEGGETEQERVFVGLPNELRVDEGNHSLRLHDAQKEGGYEFLNRDQSDTRYHPKTPELFGMKYGAQEKGLVVRTGPGLYKIRSITVNTGNLKITNPRGTAGNFLLELAEEISTDHKWTGAHEFTQEIKGTGGFRGNLIGDVDGNVTGDITGDVTGNLEGNANGDHTGSFKGDVDVSEHSIIFADGQIPEEAIDPLAFIRRGVPLGAILMWSGAVDDIPDSWALCNGLNGTPDLRNRFIVGAGDDFNPDAQGGSENPDLTTDNGGAHQHEGGVGPHALTVAEMPAHSHGVKVYPNPIDHDSGDNGDRTMWASGQVRGDFIQSEGGGQPHTHDLTMEASGAHSHNITLDARAVYPPYYALCYIMKVV